MNFFKKTDSVEGKNTIVIDSKNIDLQSLGLDEHSLGFVQRKIESEEKQILVNLYDKYLFIIIDEDAEDYKRNETLRKAGAAFAATVQSEKIETVAIRCLNGRKSSLLSVAEGLALSSYKFVKYFTKDLDKITPPLKSIELFDKDISEEELNEINAVVDATIIARNLVNEPLSYLNAVQLAMDIKKYGDDEAGYKTKILNKAKIEELGMGGLLAVNKGSIDPPTFSILSYTPENAKNEKPIVLVGKGIVYDTGGLSLKPTPGSMDEMKSDMGGGAAVFGAMYAIAKAKLPMKVIALIPATDNRPDGNAYVPGDVVKMHNGMTVEVLNTDAEGRMILADAISYAKEFDPELIIDIATLTGAAHAAIGPHGIVAMGNADRKYMDALHKSGYNTYERIAEFPFWDEYFELMKSDIADMKNIGGKLAGAITAGKFLEKFTDYPFIHLDIAGPAFIPSNDSYRTKGGTGVGVRLLFDFIKNYKQ
jgi:leucyl aminopeptidase